MKRKRAELGREGGMSELPAEILAEILSKLEIKEAAKTSVLSSRWRYMWTFFSGNLEFDGRLFVKELKWRMDLDYFIRVQGGDKFIQWLDQVMKSLQMNGNTLNGLTIRFNDDDCESSGDFDAWVKVAIQKKVKKLELDLTHTDYRRDLEKKGVNLVPSLRDFTSLHVLRLKSVHVTEDILNHLLSVCPFLHVLGVCSSASLINFKVSSLKLKVLEISHCWKLKTLQLSAENLESFSFNGKNTKIAYKSVRNVVNIDFSGMGCKFFKGDFYGFYPFLSQIKVLRMCSMGDPKGCFDVPDNFPKLLNLKHLELTFVSFMGTMNDFFTSCISLPRSCPSLTLLVLKLMTCDKRSFGLSPKFCEEYPFLCLRELEVQGFSGDSGEIEFVKLIIESAMNLEKIIIDPLPVLNHGRPDECKMRQTWDGIPIRRARAWLLESHTPPWVELLIL